MNDIAIRVDNLSKQYRIGQTTGYSTLRDTIMDRLRRPAISSTTEPTGDKHHIWALRDISFEVQRGEAVGIIGRNGSGKSTLLKIISRVTEPTSGRVALRGRVGSLLEVGTGFHPELTGRENVYLNGAIIGMTRREIRRRFDEIVAFSEVERFLDTPVKRYSSGMYVRLAFAIAAHLDHEILLVDEVLSVGDAGFRSKCLNKLDEAKRLERTLLVVSHDTTLIERLCGRVLLMLDGVVQGEGTPESVVGAYLGAPGATSPVISWAPEDAPGGDVARLRAVRVLDAPHRSSGSFALSQAFIIEVEFQCLRGGTRLNPSIHVYDSRGVCAFAAANMDSAEWGKKVYDAGLYCYRCFVPGHLLNDGTYTISAFVMRDVSAVEAAAANAVRFQVDDDGAGRGDYTGGWIGVVRPELRSTVERMGDLT